MHTNVHTHIAIVGMGPRGTSTLERLCTLAPNFLIPGGRLTIHVVEPSHPGAGRVWRTDQSPHLLMNTVASQVTLYTDESVICSGAIRDGPSLYAWAVQTGIDLGPDEYPTRALYGLYLEWVFAHTVRKAPSGVDVKVHAARGIRLDNETSNHQILELSNGTSIANLSAVILTLGHVALQPDAKMQQLTDCATTLGLRYIKPANPADIDLSAIAPRESVFLRGLGLNFFDYMALLTTGRGGRFTRTIRGLKYHPSGREPYLYAGSRRGIPHQARGDNAKGPLGTHILVVLNPEVIADLRNRVSSEDGLDFRNDVWPLVAKEVETVYYQCLLRQQTGWDQPAFLERYLAAPYGGSDEQKILDDYRIAEVDRWSWERLTCPFKGQIFSSIDEWKSWLVDYLREDVAHAKLGNVDGPLKTALDVMRDARNELRLIVEHNGLKGNSHREDLDEWYTPLNAYASIGPPRLRVEQMIALIEAGTLVVIGPNPRVQLEGGAWVAHSTDIPNSTVQATTLIEARLPEPNLRHTADDLLAYLFKTGQCRPHMVDGYETGGLDVTNRPYCIINGRGHAHPAQFALGIPTEGVRWVTAAGARPGVNSVTLADTDAVASAALRRAQNS